MIKQIAELIIGLGIILVIVVSLKNEFPLIKSELIKGSKNNISKNVFLAIIFFFGILIPYLFYTAPVFFYLQNIIIGTLVVLSIFNFKNTRKELLIGAALIVFFYILFEILINYSFSFGFMTLAALPIVLGLLVIIWLITTWALVEFYK